jgi:O-methyltransferase involved in polyketide biosynthesis
MVRQLGGAELIARSLAVRTATIDGLINRLVREKAVDLVLNLAAGMDTRPWRLPLPASLQWVDVDAAEVLAAKTTVMGAGHPRCRYRARPADITHSESRSSVLAEAAQEGGRILVLTEGLIVYLSPGQVSELARDLRRHGVCQWWLLDLVGPEALGALQQVWAPLLGPGQVAFQFAPAESSEFFLALGWREAIFQSSREEAHRLGRPMPLPWLVRALLWLSTAARREEFRRLSGVALLTPAD